MSSLKSKKENNLKAKVNKALEEIRPQLLGHGGDLKLLKAKDGRVEIRILGACLGCPYTQMTFGEGMEEMIKEQVPEVKEIKFVF